MTTASGRSRFGRTGRFWPVLFLVLALWGLRPQPAAAGSVSADSNATYEFGQAMHFALVARSDVPVGAVTLFISAPGLPNTLTRDWRVLPRQEITRHYDLDLTQVRLIPFAIVTYWWLLQDIEGTNYQVPPQTLFYEDDRFEWRQLEQNGVTASWTGEETWLGQLAVDIVFESLPRMAAIIPIQRINPVRLYLYPSAEALRAALRLTNVEWVGAHASPELGVILAVVANSSTAAYDLRQSIPHELSHLLMYQAAGVNYDNVPRWFDEGLATYFEADPLPEADALLDGAIAANTTIPFSQLCRSFPYDSDQAGLAYAQSYSLVSMIQSQAGNHTLTELVTAFMDGAECDTAVTRVLDKSLTEVERDWLSSHHPLTPAGRFLQSNGLWLLLLAASFGFMGLLLLDPTKRNAHGRA